MGIPKREVKWGGSTYSEVWIDGLREARVGGFLSHIISYHIYILAAGWILSSSVPYNPEFSSSHW
jgi:hypothetical protein